MTFPLAVIAPRIGARSETFIRRHMEDILPGGTVVFAGNADPPYAGHWSVSCPTLVANRVSRIPIKRIFRAVKRRVGFPDQDAAGLKQFLLKHGVQVIMGEFLDYALPWMPLARDMGIRFYGHAHGYDVSSVLRSKEWQEKYLEYNQADGVLTRSQAMRTKLIDLGLDARKITVSYGGIDVPDLFSKRAGGTTIRCLAVGRMVGKKAPILVLDAFRRAAEVQPNLRLDYIGAGELLPAAQQFVHAFTLSDKVTLHGPQSSEFVQQAMCEADIFLQHSIVDPDTGDEEGLPAVVTEAMAHGMPVVATRHAGIPEAVIDGENGFLVDEGDSKAMAERLVHLAANPELRCIMGEAGWQRAKAQFTWEKERNGLLQVLGLRNLPNQTS